MSVRLSLANPHAPVGPDLTWTTVTYMIRGARTAAQAMKLVADTAILHSVAHPENNRFELNAAEFGIGKIIHAGL